MIRSSFSPPRSSSSWAPERQSEKLSVFFAGAATVVAAARFGMALSLLKHVSVVRSFLLDRRQPLRHLLRGRPGVAGGGAARDGCPLPRHVRWLERGALFPRPGEEGRSPPRPRRPHPRRLHHLSLLRARLARAARRRRLLR